MPCLPCKEIINNGLMIDGLSLFMRRFSGQLVSAAEDLKDAATTANEAYAILEKHHLIAHGSHATKWHGCEHAKTIMGWVTGPDPDPDGEEHILKTLISWTADVNAAHLKAVSGELS